MNPAAGIGLALLGGGALYVGVKWWAKRQGVAEGASCEGLEGDAKTACEAINAADSIISWTEDNLGASWGPLGHGDPHRGESAENVAKNGPVVRSIPAEFINAVDNHEQEWFSVPPASWFISTDLEYANGCEPFRYRPGWSKCAPGTHENISEEHVPGERTDIGFAPYEGWRHVDFDSLGVSPECWTGLGEGKVGCDPLTFKAEGFTRFPLQCATGEEKWFVKGKATCLPACAAGSDRKYVDQRTGAVSGPPPCMPYGSVPTSTQQGTQSTGGAGHTYGDPNPAGYCWQADASITGGGYWVRARPGQPCAKKPGSTATTRVTKQFLGIGGIK